MYVDKDGSGRVSYAELVNFLLSHVGEWHRAEREIAQKLAISMGADPAARRAWLGRLRARFFGADRFRTGTLSEVALAFLWHGSGLKRAHCQIERHQAGGTGGIDGHAGTFDAQNMRNPVRNDR